MSVRTAIAKLAALAASGALVGGGAVHVAETQSTAHPQYIKHTKIAKTVAIAHRARAHRHLAAAPRKVKRIRRVITRTYEAQPQVAVAPNPVMPPLPPLPAQPASGSGGTPVVLGGGWSGGGGSEPPLREQVRAVGPCACTCVYVCVCVWGGWVGSGGVGEPPLEEQVRAGEGGAVCACVWGWRSRVREGVVRWRQSCVQQPHGLPTHLPYDLMRSTSASQASSWGTPLLTTSLPTYKSILPGAPPT